MLPFRVVHGLAGKLFVALLLTLCVAVYLLEMSGRWDQSIQDANDEASFVAIMLCIGAAVAAAGSVIAHVRAWRPTSRVLFATSPRPCRLDDLRIPLAVSTNSPPLSLRI